MGPPFRDLTMGVPAWSSPVTAATVPNASVPPWGGAGVAKPKPLGLQIYVDIEPAMFARPAAYYSASRRNEPTRHLSGKCLFDVLEQLECQLLLAPCVNAASRSPYYRKPEKQDVAGSIYIYIYIYIYI